MGAVCKRVCTGWGWACSLTCGTGAQGSEGGVGRTPGPWSSLCLFSEGDDKVAGEQG